MSQLELARALNVVVQLSMLRPETLTQPHTLELELSRYGIDLSQLDDGERQRLLDLVQRTIGPGAIG